MIEHPERIIPGPLAPPTVPALASPAIVQDANSCESRQQTKPSARTTLPTAIVTGNRTEGSSLTRVDVIPAAVRTQTGATDRARTLTALIRSTIFLLMPAADTLVLPRVIRSRPELRGCRVGVVH